MHSTKESHPQVPQYSIILLGKTGAGKSASGNSLLGKKVFMSKRSVKPVTDRVQRETMTFDGVPIHVYDTPGLFHPKTKKENDISEWRNLLSQPICPVILLVMKADAISEEDKRAVDLIEAVIPKQFFQNKWILFTRGDDLARDNLTIEGFIEETDELKEIVERFQNRYHIFNNVSQSLEQFTTLIQKIFPSMEFPPPPPAHLQTRIVLLGKTGVGKSATGNTILGKRKFRAEISSSSVTSKSEIQHAVVSGRNISVTDTPGLFDTNLTQTQLSEEIGMGYYLSRPGPHAFLYILPVNVRFTTQEEDVMEKLEEIFGKELRKHTIIVFTHGDFLQGKSVEAFIQENSSLRRLVEQCGGRYHVMNNNQREERQVTDLLEMIDTMIQQNGGMHYTNEMFQNANWFKYFKEFYHKYKEYFNAAASVAGGAAVGALVGGPVGAVAGAGAVTGTLLAAGKRLQFNEQESQAAASSGGEEGSVPNTDNKKLN